MVFDMLVAEATCCDPTCNSALICCAMNDTAAVHCTLPAESLDLQLKSCCFLQFVLWLQIFFFIFLCVCTVDELCFAVIRKVSVSHFPQYSLPTPQCLSSEAHASTRITKKKGIRSNYKFLVPIQLCKPVF
jgi:hypothetical protein